MAEINRVLFIGSKKAGLECVKKMHEIAPDKLVGITTFDDTGDSRSECQSFIDFSLSNDIPIVNGTSEHLIARFEPDLCIVSGWYWIFSKQILDSVPFGFLGFHNSLLPKYRGGSPLVWQIINGEKVTGISLFSITDEMDSGKLWAQTKFRIDEHHTIADATKTAARIAAGILERDYQKILNGELIPKPQKGIPTYCAMRRPEDGRIDWSKPAQEIYNFIRAQTRPYPGAYTTIEINKVSVWESQPIDVTYFGNCGQVVRTVKDVGVWVICGDNKPLLIKTDKILKVGTRLGQ